MEFAARLARFGGPKSCSAASERRVSCEPPRAKAGLGRAKVKVKAKAKVKVKARAKAPQAAAAPNPSSALVSSDGQSTVRVCVRPPPQSAAICSNLQHSAAQVHRIKSAAFYASSPPHPRLHRTTSLHLDKYCKFTALSQRQPFFFFAHLVHCTFLLRLLSSFSRRNFPHAHMTRSVSLFCLLVG